MTVGDLRVRATLLRWKVGEFGLRSIRSLGISRIGCGISHLTSPPAQRPAAPVFTSVLAERGVPPLSTVPG